MSTNARDKQLDFIVIGAQNAGTTSLFHYLRDHPQIALPEGKELPFFSHDSTYERGWERYVEGLAAQGDHASGGGAERKWGTVTPQYMVGGVYQPTSDAAVSDGYDTRTVPARIRQVLPDVRLVALLRDPVQRAVSHHRMLAMRGIERRSFDQAADQLLAPAALDAARRRPQERTGYIAWGEYGRILDGYFDVFAAEQILVVFTDELEHTPAQLLARIQAFIGVAADFEPENLGARYRVGAIERGFSWRSPASWMTPSSPLSPQGLARALGRNPAARGAWQSASEDRQRRAVRSYERVARRVARRNRDSDPNDVSANAPPSIATLARLREHYSADLGRLAELIGTTPPWRDDQTGAHGCTQ
jgi:hypothetical protein